MAITDLNGVAAGFQLPQPIMKSGSTQELAGQHHSLWYSQGRPGAGSAPAPGVNGAALSAPLAGQIPRSNPASGNAYVGRIALAPTSPCTILICDRLWHNSGLSVTSTTAQAITPATLPARDLNGTTDGEGVMAAIEWSALGGAGTPTVTLTYDDQDGNAGATGSFVGNTTPQIGTFEIFGLAAGDTGIRAPKSLIQTTTRTSGTMHLILFRILNTISCPIAGVAGVIDFLTGGGQKFPDDCVPFFVIIPTTTTACAISGTYIETHG